MPHEFGPHDQECSTTSTSTPQVSALSCGGGGGQVLDHIPTVPPPPLLCCLGLPSPHFTCTQHGEGLHAKAGAPTHCTPGAHSYATMPAWESHTKGQGGVHSQTHPLQCHSYTHPHQPCKEHAHTHTHTPPHSPWVHLLASTHPCTLSPGSREGESNTLGTPPCHEGLS